jgi:hypothetical protein
MDDLLRLSRQTMDVMKLHQRPHVIYTADDTGLKLTCSSGIQKLLATEVSKRVHKATHGEKGETMRVQTHKEFVKTTGFR